MRSDLDSVTPTSSLLESISSGISTGCHPPQSKSPQRQWFALRVKSNFEQTTALHLREKGYVEFVPTYTIQSRWSDRVKVLQRPLFPGYVFCSFSATNRSPILATPGVLHIVGIGKEPIPVDAKEMQAVWTTLQSGLVLRPWPILRVGERVRVERGPLAGVEGVVTHIKGIYRLVLSITLLQRSIAAELEREWIRPIELRPRGYEKHLAATSLPAILAVETRGC